ncbi:DNA phosphorothioation-dependent restriction protein DptG [Microscilla marina]|uniref:DNA phosphorothioation-dependent restriction protein DptG n=1 Tax=Microscilla marina TaxID=1027 RepID=UPI0005D46BB0|nr:DNA phosphorothioation-dependent restriction protein DptG [Microscilla marina]
MLIPALLIKYYYFNYLKQLTLSLNHFFDDFNQSIFFTLEWETLSKSRISHQNGWSLFESKARNIFSFVNFFELISYIEYKGESFFKGNFQQIKVKIEALDSAEQTELTQKLEEITQFYQQKMEAHMDKPFRPGSSWADFEQTYQPRYSLADAPVHHHLHKLWTAIDYQFIHSERDSPYSRYQAWITEFCKLNFVRNRGRLGQSLSLDQHTLLFITKLCLGKHPKIRLKNLWVEYNKRGLFFDPSSQKEIVKLFEKINLLEKKSDSGDAQYVKTIQ